MITHEHVVLRTRARFDAFDRLVKAIDIMSRGIVWIAEQGCDFTRREERTGNVSSRLLFVKQTKALAAGTSRFFSWQTMIIDR